MPAGALGKTKSHGRGRDVRSWPAIQRIWLIYPVLRRAYSSFGECLWPADPGSPAYQPRFINDQAQDDFSLYALPYGLGRINRRYVVNQVLAGGLL